MHLLVTQSGTIDDGAEPRDLGQTPGDIVVLSHADSELTLLANAHRALRDIGPAPSLRLVNLLQLKHHFSVDLYAEKTLAGARIVVLRLLGGKSYWAYGLERLIEMAADGAFELVVLPGDDQPDPQLEALSTVDDATRVALWGYLSEGGAENARGFPRNAGRTARGPRTAAAGASAAEGWALLARHVAAGSVASRAAIGSPIAPSRPSIFYRALVQSGNLAAVDALIAALAAEGLNPLPIYVTSLRDAFAGETIRRLFDDTRPDIILNSTAFAATLGGADGGPPPPFAGRDAMVLQVVFSGESEAAWAGGTRGLSPHYIAMHVALPEVDGRVLTRAVSFKSDSGFDEATQYYLTRSEPKPDRVAFVARLARGWVALRRKPEADRKLALILANYPNRDARLANGVGLDTPAKRSRSAARPCRQRLRHRRDPGGRRCA